MSQIRSALGKALPDRLPAPDWDSHDLEHRAVRSTRRRRLGGGLLVVALLGLSLLTAVNLLPGTATHTPATDPATAYPLPELDEDQPYQWVLSGSTRTTATEKLDEALTAHLNRRHPDLHSDAEVGFLRTQRQLWTAVAVEGGYEAGPSVSGSEQVYHQPMYTLAVTPDKPGVRYDSGASDAGERLTVEVYPKGGFETGTGVTPQDSRRPRPPQYLVEGCRGYKQSDAGQQTGYVSFDCDKIDIGTKLSALTVKRTVEPYGGDAAFEVTRTVAMYRDDGTAVVVAMHSSAPKAIDPELSSAELLAIADALPDIAVT